MKEVTTEDGFPSAMERVNEYIEGGIGEEDSALAGKVNALLATLPETGTLLHGDFHTGNVFLQRSEPLLIDMDRLAVGHPIIELSDLYYFYVILGEEAPAVVEKFMGFSYDTARYFMRLFLKNYLGAEDECDVKVVQLIAEMLPYPFGVILM